MVVVEFRAPFAGGGVVLLLHIRSRHAACRAACRLLGVSKYVRELAMSHQVCVTHLTTQRITVLKECIKPLVL